MVKFQNLKCILLIWIFSHPCLAQIGFVQKGVASYYSDRFKGKRTSSGIRYQPELFTAAHKKIKFNSLVKVTHLRTKKSVIVTVNDRGPYSRKRIIDLSRNAAHKLGIHTQGTAHVLIEVVGENGKIGYDLGLKHLYNRLKVGHLYDIHGQRQRRKGYSLQIAAFAELQNARIYAQVLIAEKHPEVYIKVSRIHQSTLYRVLLGRYETKSIAKRRLKKLKKEDFTGFVVSL